MSERGQVSVMACALVLLLVLAGFLIGILGGIDSAGANAQRAADMAALAAGQRAVRATRPPRPPTCAPPPVMPPATTADGWSR